MWPDYLKWAVIAVAAYQLFVTARLLFSDRYARGQKLAQLLLIWAIPLFGAVVCEVFMSSDRKIQKARDTGFSPDGGDNPPGIGLG
jgi:hypothetical protein